MPNRQDDQPDPEQPPPAPEPAAADGGPSTPPPNGNAPPPPPPPPANPALAGSGPPSASARSKSKSRSSMRRADSSALLDWAAKQDDEPLGFLQRISDRLKRVGLTFPGVEVRWEELTVEVEVPRRGAKAPTLASAALSVGGAAACSMKRAASRGADLGKSASAASLAGNGAAAAAAAAAAPSPSRRVILDAGSGALLPGRMCLLLGPPGSGKTTLLRALAGQLLPRRRAPKAPAAAERGEGGRSGRGGGAAGSMSGPGGLLLSGALTYNGQRPGVDFVVERSASFVSQQDLHLGELTVGETLAFAAQCLGPGLSQQLHELLLAKEKEAGVAPQPALDALWSAAYGPAAHTLMVELFARLLGVDHVMSTLVGNEMVKGISGGQKRRVTVGEMAVGLAQVMCLDEITNGLDSNSALAIVRALRNLCHYAKATLLVSLLQPTPEVFAAFDDVALLSGGRLVYMGPREDVVPFFSRLGLAPPPTRTDADFLQEVTASPAYQAKYRLPGGVAAAQGSKWLAPARLREEFDRSPPGEALAARLAAAPYSHELQHLVLHEQPYALSYGAMWWAVVRREWILITRNKIYFIAGAVQVCVTGFLVATTFIRMPKDSLMNANLYMSVIFFSLMTMFMGGFNFCPIYAQRLPVFYKQRDHRFLTPGAYAVACCAMRLPELALNSLLWAIMVFFSCGFAGGAGRFFIFWLNLLVAGFYSVTIFQLLGAVTRHEVMAQGLGAFMLMMSVLGSGFPIARSSIPGWWIWFYWIDPMAWCMRSMAITELTSSAWTTSAADFGEPDVSLGVYALESRGFYTAWGWVWAGIGAVVGLSLLLLAAQVAALHWLGAPPAYRPPPDDGDEVPPEADGAAHKAAAALAASTAAAAAANRHSNPSSDLGGDADGNGKGSARLDSSSDLSSDRPAAVAAVTVADGVPPPTLPSGGAAAANGGGGAAGDKAAAAGSLTVSVVAAGGDASADGLSFRPVIMAFSGVNYFVPHPQNKKEELQLLDNVSGLFVPGVLTSLMGASGAGKTTLMDVLAGRKTGGRAEGLQVVNGAPKRHAAFARVMGYVEQVDAHNPQATVEEALLFSAHLRVPRAVLPARAVRDFVRRMMDVVELGPMAGHVVGYGGGGDGLSTEARKRLTIACELVANPSIVFLDEPTTGLDARAAGMVMRAVRNTAATGRTVVCTIHQPNREIVDYFDELLLLKPGGRVIYNGALGPQQSALIAYLAAVPGVPKYEPSFNPADYMLEVTSPAAERTLGADFAELWEASPLAAAAARRIAQHLGPAAAAAATSALPAAGAGAVSPLDVEAAAAAAATHSSADAADAGATPSFAQPLPVQVWMLSRRALVSYWRNPAYNLLRFVTTLLLGLAIGTLYWNRGTKRSTLVGVLDIMGALYTGSLFLPMTNCLVVMPVVVSDRAVFYRERSSRMYSSAVFAFAQGFAEVPYLFVQSVIYVVIIYCCVQFEFSSEKAMWFWLFIWLNLQCFTYLGMGMMNLTPNMPACVALTSLFVLLWNLFCGFLIYRDDIKPWWIWAYYFNPATYSIYGCITTQLGNVNDEFIDVGGRNMTVAEYTRETFGYRYEWRGWVALILVGFVALFRLKSYLGLALLNFQVR